MNFFIAIPIPAGPWFAALPAPPGAFRMFHPDDLHLTVAFLGACGEERARAAFAAIDFALAPRIVSLGPVVPMGNPRRYSALSATLTDGREEVERAIGAARDAAFTAASAEPALRSPKAHVTLARPKRSAHDRDRREGLAWARALGPLGAHAHLERVALYTGTEDRQERLFRVLTARPLAEQSSGG